MSRTPYFDAYEQRRTVRNQTQTIDCCTINVDPLFGRSNYINATNASVCIRQSSYYRLVKVYNNDNTLIDVHLDFQPFPHADWERQNSVSRYE